MDVPTSPKSLSNRIFDHVGKALARAIPNRCFLCGGASVLDLICERCDALLPAADPDRACPVCALPGSAGVCGRCQIRLPAFDATVAGFEYRFPLVEMIQSLKYGRSLALARTLGRRLAAHACGPWDAVVPVPIHPQRLRARGFNQAIEIARPIARQWRLPLLVDPVDRVRATPPQPGLTAAERARNLRGAFASNADLSGRSLLVVDDVMTTGATLDEFARVLKARGARQVVNLVVARTPAA